jgi:hypothetical protein
MHDYESKNDDLRKRIADLKRCLAVLPAHAADCAMKRRALGDGKPLDTVVSWSACIWQPKRS